MLKHDHLSNCECTRLPHLDAAYNLARVTRLGLNSLVLALLIPIGAHAIGETNDPLNESAYEVTAQVRLFDAKSGEALKDSSEVVVSLVPLYTVRKARLNAELPHYQVTQHNKMFEPHLLVVPAGTTVEFPNYDPWFHNVFSVSRSRRFDLGLYGAGVKKAVRFDRAGVSYLFCNIHPEMMAVVLTVDSTYFGVSDNSGHISIGNVPPGKYLLQVWHARARRQTLEALQRALVVGHDDLRLPMISITLANRIPTTGKN